MIWFFACLSLFLIATQIASLLHTDKLKERLDATQAELVVAKSIPVEPRVPVRDTCSCGHHALMHSKQGGLFLGQGCSKEGTLTKPWCRCPASRDDVLYTPNPMTRLH